MLPVRSAFKNCRGQLIVCFLEVLDDGPSGLPMMRLAVKSFMVRTLRAFRPCKRTVVGKEAMVTYFSPSTPAAKIFVALPI